MNSLRLPLMKTIQINGHKIEVVFSQSTISKRVDEMAFEVAETNPQKLLAIPVLKGSFIFAADLLRSFHSADLLPEVDFMMLSSYRDKTTSSGQVEILRDIQTDVTGRDVLLIDDILESGRTLAFAKDLLMARGANRVMIAILLDKPNKRAVDINADFCGFECPDKFVVGYGMDMAHAYRQLPFVGAVIDVD